MNFASQCLAVGLGFSSDATSVSNGSAPCDNIGNNTWKPKSSAFISCSNFASYLSNNTDGKESGLEGTVNIVSSSNQTYKVGDIIHVDNGNGTAYAHAAVVTKSGTKVPIYDFAPLQDIILIQNAPVIPIQIL